MSYYLTYYMEYKRKTTDHCFFAVLPKEVDDHIEKIF